MKTPTTWLTPAFLAVLTTTAVLANSPDARRSEFCFGCFPSADAVSTAFNPANSASLVVFAHVDWGWCLDPLIEGEPCDEEPCSAFLLIKCTNIPPESRALASWYSYPDGSTKSHSTTHLPGPNVSLPINNGATPLACGKDVMFNASLPNVGTASVRIICTECEYE